MIRGTAVTYLPGDPRLEVLCSVILRHMGYRVYEARDVAEAAAMIEAEDTTLFVADAPLLQNPRVHTFCESNGVKCVSVDPTERVETLLPLLERRAAMRTLVEP